MAWNDLDVYIFGHRGEGDLEARDERNGVRYRQSYSDIGHCTMQKKVNISFNFQGEPLMEKCIFLVLVTNVLISLLKVPQHCPTFCLGVMNKKNHFLVISPKQKKSPLILTLCRLMIEFCCQS